MTGQATISTLIQRIAALLRQREEDDAWVLIETLQKRGDRKTFHAAGALCRSDESVERMIGVAILGQLGWDDEVYPFRVQTIPVLAPLLADPDAEVLHSLLFSLKHLKAHDTLLQALFLSRHPSAKVR